MSEEGRSSEVVTKILVAEGLVGVQLVVQSENAEVVVPEFQHLLDHCQHLHLPWSRLVPYFQIEPLLDRLHVSLALPRPLAALGFCAGSSPSVQAFLSLCMHSWQSRQVEAAHLIVAETDEEG